jgi:hypothetical protein
MYREEPPLVWFDVERMSPEDIARLQAAPPGAYLPYKSGDTPPMGTIRVRYPTPDELFRWRPKGPAVIEYAAPAEVRRKRTDA